MLRARGWRGRTWAMLWAVLQFALPAAVSGADAHVERDSRAQAAHVESTSASTCRPAHPTECALCQLLTQHSVGASPAALPPVADAARGRKFTECLLSAASWRGYLPSARAPPLS